MGRRQRKVTPILEPMPEQTLSNLMVEMAADDNPSFGGIPQAREAFERLAESMKDRLLRLAWRYVRQEQDAEDIIQEVLLKTYAERAHLGHVRRAEPYL